MVTVHVESVAVGHDSVPECADSTYIIPLTKFVKGCLVSWCVFLRAHFIMNPLRFSKDLLFLCDFQSI
jgi:hypothetical protein